MPVHRSFDGSRVWRRRSGKAEWLRFAGWFALALLFVLCWQAMTRDTIWAFVWDAPRQAVDIGGRMVPPRWSYLPALWHPLWDTINMATLGTLLATAMALPLAFLAARNTTPSVILARPPALFVIAASRSINGLIWALLLVTILGPGVLAGILAIAFRSIGFIAKLLYEALEEIAAEPVEAIRATGASPFNVVLWGIWPQLLPAFAGITLFRWDINIREATVLGLVGAGGLGVPLETSLNTLAWPQVTVILLIILANVVLGEWLSAKLRQAII